MPLFSPSTLRQRSQEARASTFSVEDFALPVSLALGVDLDLRCRLGGEDQNGFRDVTVKLQPLSGSDCCLELSDWHGEGQPARFSGPVPEVVRQANEFLAGQDFLYYDVTASGKLEPVVAPAVEENPLNALAQAALQCFDLPVEGKPRYFSSTQPLPESAGLSPLSESLLNPTLQKLELSGEWGQTTEAMFGVRLPPVEDRV